MPSGTTTKKMLRHPKCSISTPPSVGPMASARPLQPVHTPSAVPRSRASVQTTRMMASDAGSSSAAPTPDSARAPIRITTDGAIAHISDDTVKSAAPAMNTRRRP